MKPVIYFSATYYKIQNIRYSVKKVLRSYSWHINNKICPVCLQSTEDAMINLCCTNCFNFFFKKVKGKKLIL